MNEIEPQVIEFLHGADSYLFKNVDQVADSELETFTMACWRCFMTNAQWLLLFYENEQLVPYWQIAFTLRLLIETTADLRYVLSNKGKEVNALNAYKNFPVLTDEEFIEELRKLRGNSKERSENLLNCDIGREDRDGNIARVQKMLGDQYADIYVSLCDFNHCNYCGISIAANPTEELTKLRRGSVSIILDLCNIMRDVLAQYDKFRKLPEWLDALSKRANHKSAIKEDGEK